MPKASADKSIHGSRRTPSSRPAVASAFTAEVWRCPIDFSTEYTDEDVEAYIQWLPTVPLYVRKAMVGSNKKFKCDICRSGVTTRFRDLTRHADQHKKSGVFACNWQGCTVVALQKSNLDNHIRVAHTHEELSCDCILQEKTAECLPLVCGYAHPDRNKLSYHRKDHHGWRGLDNVEKTRSKIQPGKKCIRVPWDKNTDSFVVPGERRQLADHEDTTPQPDDLSAWTTIFDASPAHSATSVSRTAGPSSYAHPLPEGTTYAADSDVDELADSSYGHDGNHTHLPATCSTPSPRRSIDELVDDANHCDDASHSHIPAASSTPPYRSSIYDLLNNNNDGDDASYTHFTAACSTPSYRGSVSELAEDDDRSNGTGSTYSPTTGTTLMSRGGANTIAAPSAIGTPEPPSCHLRCDDHTMIFGLVRPAVMAPELDFAQVQLRVAVWDEDDYDEE